MFDFDKELSPSPIEQQELLFQVTRDCLVARLNEKIPCVIHVHVLLDPVRKVPEEFLLLKNENKKGTLACYLHSIRKRANCECHSLLQRYFRKILSADLFMEQSDGSIYHPTQGSLNNFTKSTH